VLRRSSPLVIAPDLRGCIPACAYRPSPQTAVSESPSPCLLPAVEQAALIRAGAISALELLDAHLERIDALNPAVNALVTLVPEQARAAARAADRRRAAGEQLARLHGLPIAHKDLVDTAGVRTTYGSPAFADHVPEADELLPQRLRAAGAIMVGKTNTPEWGAGSHTFNPVFGATRNPWDTSRSAGGSSGGAAVAVACRMLPFADGSDLGGSLRNPAAWNGVLGLRPTPGLVPSWPDDTPWLPFSVDGPIARTAPDVALLLAAMAGPDARAPLSLRAGAVDLDGPLDADLRGRRVAWSPSLGGLPVEPGVLALAEVAARRLAGLGMDVAEDDPDLGGADTVFETWRAFGFALSLGDLYDADGARMKATVRWNVERGRALTAADLAAATRLHAQLGERVAAFFERYDYLACPVTQVEPFPVETEYPAEIAGVPMHSYLEWMRACSRVTVMCCPAVSIPAGRTPSGLPAGLQLVARPFAERALLEVAHALDGVTGYSRELPPAAVSDR
jgi:amidase